MEKGFFNRHQKSPPLMTTRSGRVVSKPRPPAIDDHDVFPALPSHRNLAPAALKSTTLYSFEIPKFILGLQTSIAGAGGSPCAAENRVERCSSASALSHIAIEDARVLDGLGAPMLEMPSSGIGATSPVLNPAAAHPGCVAAQTMQTWTSLFKNNTSKNFTVGSVKWVLVPLKSFLAGTMEREIISESYNWKYGCLETDAAQALMKTSLSNSKH